MKKLTVDELRRKLRAGDSDINGEAAYEAALALYLSEGNGTACSILAKLAKKKQYREELAEALDITFLTERLASATPSARKNTAVLMGNIGLAEYSRPLIDALEREEYRYVRPSMLLALGAIGDPAAVAFIQRYRVAPAANEDEAKHVEAENAAVRLVLGRTVRGVHARFTGLLREYEIELRCANLLSKQLMEELEELGVRVLRDYPNAVVVSTADLRSLYGARCFSEALFPIRRSVNLTANAIAGCARDFLTELMRGATKAQPPYRYRLSLPSGLDKASFAREIAALLDSDELVNSTSFYDIELRVEQVKERCSLYAKLCCFKDTRFAYRLESLPASIAPSTAAAVLRLASDHLRSRARVLDPFCGSGTMLIERGLLSPCGALTGVDITPKAIEKAQRNVHAAGIDVELVCKDCIKFRANAPYDEVIANMPFGLRVGSHEINDKLYAQFLGKLPEWLAPGGIALLYTMEYTLLRRLISQQSELEFISRQRTEAGGLLPTVFLLRRRES
ncbi:MAG: methyltransferase domain-containing protein [Clostridia bacterium]|nr:methyltransferase domain-containing protein [Clostridia bacterium]